MCYSLSLTPVCKYQKKKKRNNFWKQKHASLKIKIHWYILLNWVRTKSYTLSWHIDVHVTSSMATNQEIVLKILGKKPILKAKIPAIAENQIPFTKKCCMCGELVNFISFCTDKCVVDCKKMLKDCSTYQGVQIPIIAARAAWIYVFQLALAIS